MPTEAAVFVALISPYTSFFEVSIALNITYAASENFRTMFKSALGSDTKKISQSFEKSVEDTYDQLSLMSENDINEEQKDKLSHRLLKILGELQEDNSKLGREIENSNGRIVDQIKPIYIFVAIINLFVLFLAGQEAVHQKFPGNEMVFIIISSYLTVILLWAFSFTEKKPPIIFISFFAIILITFSFLGVGSLHDKIGIDVKYNKYIIDLILLLSFAPFLIAFARLFFQNLWLSTKYWILGLWYKFEFYRIKGSMDDVKKAKNYLNNL